MMRRYNRLLVASYVVSDAFLGMAAFALAYLLRFQALDQILPITKGIPPIREYINMLPFVGVIVPLAFHAQGLYRLRRGRTRVDDFFAVFVGTILAGIIGLVVSLYFQAYYLEDAL